MQHIIDIVCIDTGILEHIVNPCISVHYLSQIHKHHHQHKQQQICLSTQIHLPERKAHVGYHQNCITRYSRCRSMICYQQFLSVFAKTPVQVIWLIAQVRFNCLANQAYTSHPETVNTSLQPINRDHPVHAAQTSNQSSCVCQCCHRCSSIARWVQYSGYSCVVEILINHVMKLLDTVF